MRVLYIEDNEPNAQLVKRILSHEGHEVIHFADARPGIEEAERHPPDVILMDLSLPGMNGYEAARKMREIPALREVPIVALTASVREIDRQKALAEGFAGFIEKPIRLDSFRKEIARYARKGPPAVPAGGPTR